MPRINTANSDVGDNNNDNDDSGCTEPNERHSCRRRKRMKFTTDSDSTYHAKEWKKIVDIATRNIRQSPKVSRLYPRPRPAKKIARQTTIAAAAARCITLEKSTA